MKRTSPLRRVGTRLAGDDLVLDLGTANVRMHLRGHGLVLNQPSVVAVDDRGDVVAAGEDAMRRLRRRSPGLQLHRPLRGGVIADFEATASMVRTFLGMVTRPSLVGRPAVVVCVPSGIAAEQRTAFQDVVLAAGARAGFVIEDPVAAAIGTGLPFADETASMLIDAGAGTTDVAVLSLGGIVVSRSTPVGGNDLDEAISHHLLDSHSLRVGKRAAERVKIALGDLAEEGSSGAVEVRGRETRTGQPASTVVNAQELRQALETPVAQIVDSVRATLEAAPDHLAVDLIDRGALLTGGTALLPGLADRISAATGIPVRVSDDPLYRVAAGAGACLDTADDLAVVFAGAGRHA